MRISRRNTMYLFLRIFTLITTTVFLVSCFDGDSAHYKDPIREEDDIERIRHQHDLHDHVEHQNYGHENEDFDDMDVDNDDFRDQRNELEVDHDDNERDRERYDEEENHHGSSLCKTPACILAAADIISSMNASADPCGDFHNYVCGKFPDTYEPYEDMRRSMSFEIRRRKNAYDLHRILKKFSYNNELKSLDSVKAAYDSCMDEDYLNKHGASHVQKLIARFGPWPLGDSWNESTWNFKKTLNDLVSNLPLSLFLDTYVALDSKNPEHYTFQVHQARMSLPKDYFLSKRKRETKVRETYFKMMVTIMKLLGFKAANLTNRMRQVLEFEIKLGNISLPGHLLRQEDKLYKKMAIKDLAKMVSNIDLKGQIERSLKLVNYSLDDVKHVVVIGESYAKNVERLISETPKETLANFLLWKIALKFTSFGGKKFHDAKFVFDRVYTGAKAQHPVWSSCINIVMSWMPFAIGRLYVDHNFKNKHAKHEVSDIIHRIKGAFIENLPHVHWMDQKTRHKAESKASAMVQLVAYPEFILDNKKLDERYANVSLKKNEFLGNYLRIFRDIRRKNILKLKKKRDRKDWNSGPQVVNAFYSPVYNRIVFPAGILQPLYYHPTYPPSLNFGAIGTVIGHELTHGFDDNGRKYDKNGHLRQWWEKSSIARFKKVADCIRKQYSAYKIYGRHLNGQLSCGENMADNGGVKLAYKAFKDFINENRPVLKKLPGLEHLSHDQLFYVAFAKIWCIIESKAATIKNIYTDPHSYPKYRVIGALSNSAGFSKAFHCHLGSPMNPHKKCKVW